MQPSLSNAHSITSPETGDNSTSREMGSFTNGNGLSVHIKKSLVRTMTYEAFTELLSALGKLDRVDVMEEMAEEGAWNCT